MSIYMILALGAGLSFAQSSVQSVTNDPLQAVERLILDPDPRLNYSSITHIPVDTLLKFCADQGTPAYVSKGDYIRLMCSDLHTESIKLYDSVVAANDFHRTYKLLPIEAQMVGLKAIAFFYERIEMYENRLKAILDLCEARARIPDSNHCQEIANSYFDLKQYSQALLYFKGNLDQALTGDRMIVIASEYNNIGLCHERLGQNDSALLAYRNALAELNSPKTRIVDRDQRYFSYFQDIIHWNMSELNVSEYSDIERDSLALRILANARHYAEANWIITTLRHLTMSNYQMKDVDKAMQYCNEALDLCDHYSMMGKRAEFLEWKGRIFFLKGDPDQADQQFEWAHQIQDSLDLANSGRAAIVASAMFESKKNAEKLKESEAVAQDAERKRQNFTLTAILVSIIAVILVILIVIIYLSRARIFAQKEQLEQSLTEKEVLLKEIHHRVKNNLQVISSLLDLQTLKMDEGVAKEALEEGKSRVQSIAILHHQLYQHDDLAQVELGAFTTELAHQVMGVFKKSNDHVDMNIQIEDTMIDIDTAVPLGLIINELLTNSFKYAFLATGVGRIDIELQNSNGNRTLIYKDNGPGLPADTDISQAKTLGLRLIAKLSKQFKGSSGYRYSNGAEFSIKF